MNPTTNHQKYQLFFTDDKKLTTKSPSYHYNQDKCSICLMDYEKGDDITLINCNHIYHKNCINNFLNHGPSHIQKKCPVCREVIIKSTLSHSNYGITLLKKPSYLMEIQKPDYEIKTTEIKGCFDIFDNLPKIIQDMILKQLINPIFVCDGNNKYEIEKLSKVERIIEK